VTHDVHTYMCGVNGLVPDRGVSCTVLITMASAVIYYKISFFQ